MPKAVPRLLAAVLALVAVFSAAAAEINVLCSGAMRGVLQQLAPDFQKASGHQLVIEYATAGKVEERVAADEPIDVASSGGSQAGRDLMLQDDVLWRMPGAIHGGRGARTAA